MAKEEKKVLLQDEEMEQNLSQPTDNPENKQKRIKSSQEAIETEKKTLLLKKKQLQTYKFEIDHLEQKIRLDQQQLNSMKTENKILKAKDLKSIVENRNKIDLSESEIIRILEETQNPVMSKTELIESIQSKLLNEADMNDDVKRSFDDGDNDYAGHLDPETTKRIAQDAFNEIQQNIRQKTGRQRVTMDDVQMLLGQSLMMAIQEEQRIGIPNLERKAVDMIRRQFNIPEDAVDFQAEITGIPQMGGRPITKGNIQYDKGTKQAPEGKTDEQMKPKVTRRRFTNAMMQGAARKSQNLHHMDDELRQTNPRLGGNYANIMAANDAMYWMMSDNDIKSQGQEGMHAGNVRVELSRTEGGKPKIIAQGIVFPILLHELAKGVVELMSLWSLPQDAEERKYVLDKTDNLESETNDIRLGPTLWAKFVAEIPVDNQEVISLTWHKMQELSDYDFNQTIEGLLNGSQQARNTVKDLANEAIEEIRTEEYEGALGSSEPDPEDGEKPEGEEDEYADPELDKLISQNQTQDDGELPMEQWETSDLRQAFDEALDDGDMVLVRQIGDILRNR